MADRAGTPDAAAERAGVRLGLALVGAAAVAAAVVPLAVLVRLSWPPLLALDQAVTGAAERAVSSAPPLLTAARAVTLLGDPTLTWALTGVLALVLAVRRRLPLAVFLVAVKAGVQLLSTTLKTVLDRTRPLFDEPVHTALGGSFPSGHTLAAVGFWSALAVVALPAVRPGHRRWLVAAAAGTALLVAASRVLLGVHYLSDVVGGLLLGAGWTVVCAAVLVRWRVESGRPAPTVADAVEPPPEPRGQAPR